MCPYAQWCGNWTDCWKKNNLSCRNISWKATLLAARQEILGAPNLLFIGGKKAVVPLKESQCSMKVFFFFFVFQIRSSIETYKEPAKIWIPQTDSFKWPRITLLTNTKFSAIRHSCTTFFNIWCMKMHDLQLSLVKNVPPSTSGEASFQFEYVWVYPIREPLLSLLGERHTNLGVIASALLTWISDRPLSTPLAPGCTYWLCTHQGGAPIVCSYIRPKETHVREINRWNQKHLNYRIQNMQYLCGCEKIPDINNLRGDRFILTYAFRG
jgi:hypothetical protein